MELALPVINSQFITQGNVQISTGNKQEYNIEYVTCKM